jgi:hypothetical protein
VHRDRGALGLPAFPWPDPLREFLHVVPHVFVYGTLVTTVGSGTSYVLKTRNLLLRGKPA